MAENKQILTVGNKQFIVRWRGLIDRPTFPGVRTLGYCFTGTINQYRLPHLHQTVEKLLFCAWELANGSIANPDLFENNLGKPDDLEAFLR